MRRTHGFSVPDATGRQRPTYIVWKAMRMRCTNPENISYPNYGGRGIVVCERWHSFENFLADMGERPPGMQIDRIDNDGPYSPDNCRWVDRKTQCRNKSTNTLVTWNGRTQTISAWCEETGAEERTVSNRLKRGYSPERAFIVGHALKNGHKVYEHGHPTSYDRGCRCNRCREGKHALYLKQRAKKLMTKSAA